MYEDSADDSFWLTARLKGDDPAVQTAAERVARYVNLRQAAGEAGPAFVKRIALALLDEMAGGR